MVFDMVKASLGHCFLVRFVSITHVLCLIFVIQVFFLLFSVFFFCVHVFLFWAGTLLGVYYITGDGDA